MTNIDEQSIIKVPEWLEMGYIGQHYNNCVPLPDEHTTFVYSPTGRICTYIKNLTNVYGEFDYIFTFVDLENKVCYDIKFENKTKVDSFYFISEDVLVIVAAYNTLVKQSVYKVDYINQKFELKETIEHSFMNRTDFYRFGFKFFKILGQPNKFVKLDGIEYIVLIGENEKDFEYDGGDTDLYLFRVYLIPKDPAMKDAPVKEFQVHFTFKDDIISKTLRKLLGTDAEKYEFFVCYKDDVHTCFIHRTKLYFSVSIRGIAPDRQDEFGTLIGAYWTVDLTKLEDIKNRNVGYRQLIREQVDAYEFVNTGELHFAEKVYLREMDNNMGLICLFRKNKDSSIGHLYKWNINDGTKPKVIEYPIPYDTRSSEWAYGFTLYTNGTPLIFAFNKKNLSVYFKVAKCLKLNLQSLAFNRTFFHKNTPLRYHPAYRLCYGRMQPLKYKEQFSDEIPENMVDYNKLML